MKRFIFGIIAVIGALLLLGAMWHLNNRKEFSFEGYRKELGRREMRILELQDSIDSLKEKVEVYELFWGWLRETNPDVMKEIESACHIYWKEDSL